MMDIMSVRVIVRMVVRVMMTHVYFQIELEFSSQISGSTGL
jgi:hypothetical protein